MIPPGPSSQPPQPRQAKHFSVGPGLYKIPAMRNTPRDFRVHVLEDSAGPSILGSKAVGEPPLFLGCAVYFAILEAIKAYNAETGYPMPPRLDSPLTAEQIRLACRDALLNPEGARRQPSVGGSQEAVQWWHARV